MSTPSNGAPILCQILHAAPPCLRCHARLCLLARLDNLVLRPLALETIGAMGEQFQEFLPDCANIRRHYARVSEDDMTWIIQAMAHRFSITLMTAQDHVIHGWARQQQPVLTAPSAPPCTQHRPMLYWSGLSIKLDHFLGRHEEDGRSVMYQGTLPLHYRCLNLLSSVDWTWYPFHNF